MSHTTPTITITSTTYNREKYIGEAIESWLMQKTTYSYHILIRDNCSTDATVKVINHYIEKYPGKITLVVSDKNRGMMDNFFKVLEMATGKYVANCDGDDYWIDEHKLQKQADFLEANPDFSSIYTNSLIREEVTGEKKVAKLKVWDEADTAELLDHHDFINDNLHLSPGHISSIMFRNHLIPKFPDWIYGSYLNDFPLYIMLSKFGKAKFINENCTVYRVQPMGVSSHQFSYVNTYKDRIYNYKQLDTYFNKKFTKKIRPLVARHYYNIARYFYKRKEWVHALPFLFKSLYHGKRYRS